jgi:CheY-like chemotaxis protein
LCIAEFDPYRLVEEVAASVATRAHEKGLRLDVTFQPGLPRVLEGDEGRLRQVLFNLIGNAVKFTERGSVGVEVSFDTLEAERVAVAIAVRDTGIGIPADVVPTLFERFIQADSGIARRYGGSGLGLAISRGLVDLMGGRISVQTEPGRGSTFTVTVELQRGQSTRVQALDSQVLVPHDLHGGLRILVAEDNEVNQMVISAMLAQMGYECEVARDGLEAVEKVRHGAYDLVLMDIHMPNLDGLAATRRIRALGGRAARLPIVALTANAMRDHVEACLNAGMDDYVSKPVGQRDLTRAIARAVALEFAPS